MSADDEEFAPGWQVWSDADDKLVVAYRPDVFDGRAFPAACMPTIYVTQGRRSRRPGADRNPPPGTPWYVTLFLEPDVSRDAEQFDDESAAREGARDLARRFAAGDIDYRGLYQVPREAYFAKLDELTGRDD
ncbi:DUF5820 family protein [Halorarius litoreus]|uniref:DUF5820 family protein n=1 Tax=Halorarius litoreus TaxID=2962676 RepID=UPI0020CBEF78|nr:DUF5820 family protein [Halorarius litoreus]